MRQDDKKKGSGKQPARKRTKREESAYLWHFENMDRINRAMQGTNDLEEMMKHVLDTLLSVFECDRAFLVYPCDPEADTWQVPMERTRPEYPGASPIGVEMPLTPPGAEVFRTLRAANGPVRFGPGLENEVDPGIRQNFRIQSYIAMALYPKIGKPWSFGLHQCSYVRDWTAEEERLFQEIGRRLSDTLTSLLVHRNLQESEEKYRTLIQKIQAAVVVHGADTQILTSNPMAQELLGLTEGQMLGKTSIDPAWNFLFEDGTAMPPEKYPVNQVLGSHKPLRNFIAGVHRPDNENDVWVLVNADPVFSKEGGITQVIVTFIDITERRQAEEALRKSEQRYHGLFEDSSISIWEEDFSLLKQRLDVLRQEGVKDFAAYFNDHPELLTEYASQIKVVDINKATLKMFEAQTKSELLENVAQVIKNDDFGIFREELVKIANGELDFQWEEPNQTLTGNQIYIHFRWTVVPGFEDTLSRVIVSIIDITQRKQAEDALRESEWRYHEVFDNVLDSLYLLEVTEDGRFRNLEINPAFEKSTGLPRTQLIGKFIEETVPEEVASIVNAKYRRCVEAGHPIEEEVELDLPAGRRYFHSTLIPARDETGRVHRIIGISRDITERKQAEMALSRERKLLRTLVDNLPEEVYVKDRERRFLLVNELLVRALGAQSMDEVIGKRDEDFWPPYLAKQFADEENELMRTGKPLLNDEHTPPHKSGPKRWLLRTKLPLRDGAGNIIGLAGLGSDITERKQAEQAVRESEERLRQIASSLREVVWLRDAKTRQVLYVNPAFQELTGRTCESFYENRDLLRDAIHPDDREEVTKALDQRSPSVPFDTEHRIIHLNGNVRWVSSKSFAVRNEAGEVYRWATIMEDITERKLATVSLRESERRLVAAQRMAHVGYWERDFDTNRVTLSDEACRIFGIAEQGLSLNLDEWHPRWVALIHPEDQPRLIQLLGDVLAGIRSYDVEYRVIRPDGAVRFIYSQAEVKRDVSGHAHNMLGMMQDITERKQAEQALRASENRFRVLSENAFVGIYIIQDGRLSYVNSTLAKIFGYTPEELTGADPALVIHPDDRAMVSENIRRRIVGEVETVHYEFRGRCKDGGTKNIEVLGGRIDFGGKTAVIGNLMDITERKHHELEREAIISVSKALRQATTRTEILAVILDQLVELFEADGSLIALPNPVGGGVKIEMGRGVVGTKFSGLDIPPGLGVSGWVIENKKTYLNNNAHVDSLFYHSDLLGDAHCVASVPLIAQERAIGALWVARKNDITEQNVRLLNAIADIAANAIHRVTLYERTEQQLHHLIALHQIDIAISTNFDVNVMLNVILTNVKNELEVDAASILLLDPVTHTLDYAAGIGYRARGIEQSHVKLGEGYAGKAALEYRTVSCPDLGVVRGAFSRSSLLADEEFVSHSVTPLLAKGQVKGVLEIFHRKIFEFEPEWVNYFETLATQTAIAIESTSLFENLQRSNMELRLAYDATIEGWSRALDLRDRETEGHTQRVTEMVLKLAEKMGMSDAKKTDLRRGALLHDIGKMGVPDSVLLKPGLLSESEWEIMRQHPLYAFQMLSPITYLKHALDIPYCHHEKWDGSGYPRGLKGEEIPLSARMFSVVDVFDALASDRPYRAAWSPEKIHRYIQEQAGKHFDPQVVKIFLETI